MKRMMMVVALALVVCGAQGQKIARDRNGVEYAYIDSMPVNTLYGCYVTRMVLRITQYTSQTVSFNWRLQYPYVVDNTTTNYFDFTSGDVTLPITDTSVSVGRAYKMMWQYAADSALVNGRFLLNVNYRE